MNAVFRDIGNAYQQGILDPGKQPELFMLLAFLITFGFIRTSVHLIRKGVSWWPGNVETKGGLHIHHLVWGILLLISVGFVAITFYPKPPWQDVLAVLFGVGMGLTLDEFALWLNLEDVYWAAKGRESVDAVIVAATLIGILLLGLRFWVDLGQAAVSGLTGLDNAPGNRTGNSFVLGLTQLIWVVCALIAFLKRKIFVGVVGLFVPLVALIGAVRLAKPNSWWARSRYRAERIAKASARFPEEKSADQPNAPNLAA